MRVLDTVGMIAADTSRSRAYIQALLLNGLAPGYVLMLDDEKRAEKYDENTEKKSYAAPWGEFFPHRTLQESLRAANLILRTAPDPDINAPETICAIAMRSEPVFIYSGFGGVILRSSVLETGKEFLHVHGGFLPDFKGSTTNYYSFLENGTCGASAIFMRPELDSGPLLLRRQWWFTSIQEMDYCLDAALRAQVLVQTIQHYLENGGWPDAVLSKEENVQGRMYYIMHPLLRHIALFG